MVEPALIAKARAQDLIEEAEAINCWNDASIYCS